MDYPNIISIEDVVASSCTTEYRTPEGNVRWVPARPLGFASLSYRLRAAWMVWTGRADALTWPGQ